MPFRSLGFILKTPDIEKGIRVTPKSSHIKGGINGRTAYTTTSRQGKTVVVGPYLISSERICQVPKTVKIGRENIRTATRGYRKCTVRYHKVSLVEFET